MHSPTVQLVQSYYDAFNRQDMAGFLGLLSEDVAHDINQGARETGKPAFDSFMKRMNEHYREQIEELSVLADDTGSLAAAEFTVVGEYLKTDDGLPEAHGQTYRLRACAFFSIDDGKITRVSNFYNLPEWIAQVSG
jgi:steroid delta-isomerase-like uncharacterized protein